MRIKDIVNKEADAIIIHNLVSWDEKKNFFH